MIVSYEYPDHQRLLTEYKLFLYNSIAREGIPEILTHESLPPRRYSKTKVVWFDHQENTSEIKVDFGFYTMALLPKLRRAGSYRVLLDKEGVSTQIKNVVPDKTRVPTEEEFVSVCSRIE